MKIFILMTLTIFSLYSKDCEITENGFMSVEIPCDKKSVIGKDGKLKYRYYNLCDELKLDKEIVLASNWRYMHIDKLSDELKKDRDVAFSAAAKRNNGLRYFDDSIKDDKEFVIFAISNNYDFFEEVSDRLKKDKDVVRAAVKKWGPAIKYADKSLRNDKELILLGLAEYSFRVNISLCDFDKNLGKDKEFMRKVIKVKPRFIEIASKEHFKDKIFVMELLDAGIYEIAYKIDDKLLADKEVAYALLGLKGHTFSYLDKSLKEDKELVKFALTKYTFNYQELSEKLRNDKELAKIVLSRNGRMMAYAGDKVNSDRELAKIAIKHDARAFENVSASLRDDIEIATFAVSTYADMYKYVSPRLKKDKTLASVAILEERSIMLKYVDKTLQDNKELVKIAVKKRGDSIIYASKRLQKDPEILKIAKQSPWVVYSLDTGEIEHKVKPKAWKQYSVNTTLDELYGENINIINDDEINATFGIYLEVNTKIKVKSLAIMQERDGRTSLVSLIYPQNQSINSLKLPVEYVDCTFPRMSLHVAVQDLNNTLHKSIIKFKSQSNCCYGDTWDGYDGTLKKYTKKIDKNREIFEPGFRAKAKYIDGITKVKFFSRSEIVSYDKAQKENISVEYISHVEVKNKDELIYDIYYSQYNKTRLSQFKTTKVKTGDILSFKITNIHGEVYTKEVKVK